MILRPWSEKVVALLPVVDSNQRHGNSGVGVHEGRGRGGLLDRRLFQKKNELTCSTPMMKSFLTVLCLVICTTFSGQLFAQQNCPTVSSVKKWEVISASKLLAYDNNDQYYFFMNIETLSIPFANMPKVGGPVTLRFFSSTICMSDTIVVNSVSTRVSSLEGIRR
jgi:hypothetical protein